MNRNDPRQRGLLGAAWSFAYFAHFAHFARHQAEAVALGGRTGPFGALHSKSAWPQAWYDKHKGLYPVFQILRGFSRLKGATLLDTEINRPRDVQALAAQRKDGKVELWIANLPGEPVTVDIGRKFAGGRVALLDEQTFIRAAGRPDLLDRANTAVTGPRMKLTPYGVFRVVLG